MYSSRMNQGYNLIDEMGRLIMDEVGRVVLAALIQPCCQLYIYSLSYISRFLFDES